MTRTSPQLNQRTRSHPAENDWHRGRPQPMVLFGQNAELKAVIRRKWWWSSAARRKFTGKSKKLWWPSAENVEVDGNVGDAVVGVMGNVHLNPGAKIRKDAVAVLGTRFCRAGSNNRRQCGFGRRQSRCGGRRDRPRTKNQRRFANPIHKQWPAGQMAEVLRI